MSQPHNLVHNICMSDVSDYCVLVNFANISLKIIYFVFLPLVPFQSFDVMPRPKFQSFHEMPGNFRHYAKWLVVTGITRNAWLHRLPVTYIYISSHSPLWLLYSLVHVWFIFFCNVWMTISRKSSVVRTYINACILSLGIFSQCGSMKSDYNAKLYVL